MPSPIPMIGPISGDISMAPMMTAVEFMFKPKLAISTAQIRIHRLAPLKLVPLTMLSMASVSSILSWSSDRSALIFRLIIFSIFFCLR